MMGLLLAFASGYFFFLTAPIVLRVKLGPDPTPTAGAMLDILTPFVIVGIYALLYRTNAVERLPRGPKGLLWSKIAFAFFAILFVEGHGMHLSANSINSFLGQSRGSEAYAIAYFYDELLSHYLWRFGAVGLTGVVLARHWRGWEGGARRGLLAVACAAYGLTYAVAATESQTVPMDLPASAAIAAVFGARWWTQRTVPGDLVFAFFGTAHGLAVLALTAWGLYFTGFPEPSSLLRG